jgi:hypothetical protein
MRLESESFVVAEWRDDGTTRRDFPVAPLHVHHALTGPCPGSSMGTIRLRTASRPAAASMPRFVFA